MAKNDSQSSRAAALADNEDFDEVSRSRTLAQAALKPRSARSTPDRSITDRSTWGEAGSAGTRLRPTATAAPETDDGDYLRARQRVPVRPSFFPRSRIGRALFGLGAALLLAALVFAFLAIRHFFEHDPRFQIGSASSIQILGNSQVTRPELLAVFGGDIGRNIFFVPLSARRAELEALPWVQHATVMRLLPDQLRVAITERTPVAFIRNGNHIGLVDAEGVVLSMPPSMMAAKHYSFPVVTGIAASDDAQGRARHMHDYERFVGDLDQTGAQVSEQLSEVDLSDPEDIRAVLPSAGSDILVHFGDENFAERYRTYQEHLPGWKAQYPHLAAVDLRYAHQTVLEMAKGYGEAKPDEAGAGDGAPGERRQPSLVAARAAARTAAAKSARRPAAALARPAAASAKGRRHATAHAVRSKASIVTKGKGAGRG